MILYFQMEYLIQKKKFKGKDTKFSYVTFSKEKEKFLELIGKTEINKLVDEDEIFENNPRLFGVSSSGDKKRQL